MAFPTNVNDQITDSVSQVNTKVLGDAPAIAMGNLFEAVSQALSNAAHNATNNQQQSNVTAQASTTQGVSTLLSVDTASAGEATQTIFAAAPPAPPSEPSEAATEQAIQAAMAAQEAAMQAAQDNADQAIQAALAAQEAAIAQAEAEADAAIAAATGTVPKD
ncbi:RebB family R body protein [Caulobacter zeae]|uniref:RebB family R body protein n=1 Tax=Caulobacter zeae TaxID=2055137 RepID=UPI00196AF398|nr:RebB family R body protein [Caulobacter zeae]